MILGTEQRRTLLEIRMLISSPMEDIRTAKRLLDRMLAPPSKNPIAEEVSNAIDALIAGDLVRASASLDRARIGCIFRQMGTQ